MHKVIVLSGFVLLCTGCGAVTPSPSPSPITSSTTSIDPRCLMSPSPSLGGTGIICPGGTSTDTRVTPSPISTIVESTSMPSSSASPLPSFTPRPAVTTSDIACLTGRWNQGSTELFFQYLQTLPSSPPLVRSGSSIDFNFTRTGNSGTFTQTFNNVVLEISRRNALSTGGLDNYKFTFNGTASGSYQKNDDGKIYFFDVRPDGATMTIELNGRQMLSDPSLSGDMFPIYATEVGVSCHDQLLQLTYKIPSRPTTIYLDRR